MIVEFEYTTGRKREVQPEDCLGLVLVWMQTRGSLNVLQLVFGLTYTNLSVYMRFGMRLFVQTFRDIRGGNRVLKRSVCSMASTSNRLLGNNGRPEALFATVVECNDPRMLLQWLDT